jgi:beta-lactamase class A
VSWAEVVARIADYASTRTGDVEVAIADLGTGSVIDLGVDDPIRTASIIKVAIAVTVLRQDADAGRAPSDDEMATMTAMIEESDNSAAQALWDQIGGAAGIQPTLDAAGMTATTPDDDAWGFTTTTAADQARLLLALDHGELLSDTDTATVLDLMRNVDPAQRFGPAQAAPDLDPAVKNGWYEDVDDSVWRVNCLALFDSGVTHPFAISILTRYDDSLGEAYGQQTAQDITTIALAYAR